MKIVIVGIGTVGTSITEYLTSEGHDVVAVDLRPDIVEEAINNNDVMGIIGDGVSLIINRNPSLISADVLIATTTSDETNMLCCLLAKKLGVKYTISRIRNPEFSKQFGTISSELGVDLAVNPELSTAREITRMIRFPNAMKVDSFAHGKVDLTEMKIPSNSVLSGMKVMDIQRKLNVEVLVCAVQRGNDLFIPNGNFELKAEDLIHFIAPHYELANVFKAFKYEPHKLKNILLFGGGNVSYYLASLLVGYGFSVTIAEKDEKRCNDLSMKLGNVKIINGEPTDTELFDEEDFKSYDCAVSLTDNDEENLIITLYSKQFGIKKTITKINNPNLSQMIYQLTTDNSISPKNVVPGILLSYIRGLSNAEGTSVKTLYKIIDDKAEAIEFSAFNNSKICGKKIKDLKLKKNLLIACITRKNGIIVPHGEDVIYPDDDVIVVTTNGKLSSIDDILA